MCSWDTHRALYFFCCCSLCNILHYTFVHLFIQAGFELFFMSPRLFLFVFFFGCLIFISPHFLRMRLLCEKHYITNHHFISRPPELPRHILLLLFAKVVLGSQIGGSARPALPFGFAGGRRGFRRRRLFGRDICCIPLDQHVATHVIWRYHVDETQDGVEGDHPLQQRRHNHGQVSTWGPPSPRPWLPPCPM